MLDTVLNNPWVRAIGLAAALVLLGLLVYFLSFVLIPLFLAFLVAYLLDPVVDFFERRKVPRGVTIGVLAVIGILLMFLVPFFVVNGLISQANALIQATQEASQQEYDNQALQWIDETLRRLPLDQIISSLGWAPEDGDPYDPLRVIGQKVATYVKENAVEFLSAHPASIAQAGGGAGGTMAGVLASLGRWVMEFIIFVGNFALFAFVAGYLLKDFDTVLATSRELIPRRYVGKVSDIMTKIDRQLRSFLRGQLTVAICLGAMYGLGMLSAGTPFAILIALFGTVVGFIPYLGVIMTVVPAVFLTLIRWGIDWHIVVVVLTFVFAQAIEGNVLTPKIVGQQVGLSEVWVILAVVVFGSIFGFLGLLLAVPTAAVLKVLVLEGVDYYKRSSVFNDAASDGG